MFHHCHQLALQQRRLRLQQLCRSGMQVDSRRESFLELSACQLIGYAVGLHLFYHLLRLFQVGQPVLPSLAGELFQFPLLVFVGLSGDALVVFCLANAGDGLQTVEQGYAQRGT